jgi:hypothetical protein
MTFDIQTKTGKLAQALINKGESLTAAMAKKRFGIENVRSAVSRIRQLGYTVNAVQTKAKNGVVTTKYQHVKGAVTAVKAVRVKMASAKKSKKA